MEIKLLDFFLKINGFKVDSENIVTTSTLWSQFICNKIVEQGGMVKLRKNRYKLTN